MLIKKTRLTQGGETIVEVLIAAAILGLVLSVSYALANRSTQITQGSQERSEALRIGEQQTEQLQQSISNNADVPKDSQFCFDQNNNLTSSVPCRFGADNRYATSIEFVPGPNVFEVTTDWDRLGGGSDELVVYYRDDPEVEARAMGPAPDPSEPPEPDPEVTLTVANPGGAGTITGPGIRCGQGNSNCSETYAPGASLQLSVAPAANYNFRNWTPSNCANFVINSNTTCRANFSFNPPPPRKPLYRCYMYYNWAGNPHIYTNHLYWAGEPNTVGCYPGVGGNRHYEGVMGYVPYSSNPGRQPVYGGWNTSAYDAFYTMNYQEYVNAHYAGWNYTSGVQYYAYPYPCRVEGTTPVYRWWSGYVGNHFYTINPNENPNYFYAVDGGGTFVYEGIMGCIFRNRN